MKFSCNYLLIGIILFTPFDQLFSYPNNDLVQYYGEIKLNHFSNDHIQLKNILYKIVSKKHVRILNDKFSTDRLLNNCPDKTDQNSICFGHKPLTYKEAKHYLFGQIYLKYINNRYMIKDVYCNKEYTDSDFVQYGLILPQIGPMLTPHHEVINAEHTWPKSRFETNLKNINLVSLLYQTKKSDLHHLFPSDMQMNSERKSYEFGVITIV